MENHWFTGDSKSAMGTSFIKVSPPLPDTLIDEDQLVLVYFSRLYSRTREINYGQQPMKTVHSSSQPRLRGKEILVMGLKAST